VLITRNTGPVIGLLIGLLALGMCQINYSPNLQKFLKESGIHAPEDSELRTKHPLNLNERLREQVSTPEDTRDPIYGQHLPH